MKTFAVSVLSREEPINIVLQWIDADYFLVTDRSWNFYRRGERQSKLLSEQKINTDDLIAAIAISPNLLIREKVL